MPEFERQASFPLCQSGMPEILSADPHKRAVAGIDAGEPSPMVRGYHGQAVSIRAERNDADIECIQPNASDARTGGDSDRGPDECSHFHPSTAERRAVTPGCKLRPQCSPDSHNIEAVADPSQTDVVCREADTCALEELLARFNDFESLFDRGEIPAGALSADDPETSLGWIEGYTDAEWKYLEHLVTSERTSAEHTSRVHKYCDLRRFTSTRGYRHKTASSQDYPIDMTSFFLQP